MTSHSHSNFIYEFIKLCHYKTYLELGIYDGETFSKIVPIVDIAVGVDIEDKRIIKNGIFFKSTTDDFFTKNFQKFDCVFIDACHEAKQVEKDFLNAIKILNIGGTIILHDTDPISGFYIQPGYCGDAYKVLNKIGKEFAQMTFPINECGITFIRRVSDRRVLCL